MGWLTHCVREMDRYKMGSRMTDKDYKEQGNKYFNANKFDTAIESYSKAATTAVTSYLQTQFIC